MRSRLEHGYVVAPREAGEAQPPVRKATLPGCGTGYDQAGSWPVDESLYYRGGVVEGVRSLSCTRVHACRTRLRQLLIAPSLFSCEITGTASGAGAVP